MGLHSRRRGWIEGDGEVGRGGVGVGEGVGLDEVRSNWNLITKWTQDEIIVLGIFFFSTIFYSKKTVMFK